MAAWHKSDWGLSYAITIFTSYVKRSMVIFLYAASRHPIRKSGLWVATINELLFSTANFDKCLPKIVEVGGCKCASGSSMRTILNG